MQNKDTSRNDWVDERDLGRVNWGIPEKKVNRCKRLTNQHGALFPQQFFSPTTLWSGKIEAFSRGSLRARYVGGGLKGSSSLEKPEAIGARTASSPWKELCIWAQERMDLQYLSFVFFDGVLVPGEDFDSSKTSAKAASKLPPHAFAWALDHHERPPNSFWRLLCWAQSNSQTPQDPSNITRAKIKF
jgi:hypothetical protein